MAFNIEVENARHAAGWSGFVKFITISSVLIAITLLLMAWFLL
jgi:hypothetical protein